MRELVVATAGGAPAPDKTDLQQASTMKVIDVHTHMLNDGFIRLLKRHGGHYSAKKVKGGQTGIHRDGAPFMTLTPGMFDYELRIKKMDDAKVDIAIVTLTSPNC